MFSNILFIGVAETYATLNSPLSNFGKSVLPNEWTSVSKRRLAVLESMGLLDAFRAMRVISPTQAGEDAEGKPAE
jgi:hypothetical protein